MEAQGCCAVFTPRPSTAAVLGWDPAQHPNTQPYTSAGDAAELGALPCRRGPVGTSCTWRERSRTRLQPQGCGAPPAAWAVGSPTSRVGFGDGWARGERPVPVQGGRCKQALP